MGYSQWDHKELDMTEKLPVYAIYYIYIHVLYTHVYILYVCVFLAENQ